jgi:hypothetical protein
MALPGAPVPTPPLPVPVSVVADEAELIDLRTLDVGQHAVDNLIA